MNVILEYIDCGYTKKVYTSTWICVQTKKTEWLVSNITF